MSAPKIPMMTTLNTFWSIALCSSQEGEVSHLLTLYTTAMKNLTLAFCLSVLLSLSLAFAQAPQKIGFVNTTALLANHPSGTAAADLARQRDIELTPLVEELQSLQQKATTAELSADERSRISILLRTVDETRKRYDEDIRSASEPAVAAINAAIAAVAQANGYTLILDGEIAGIEGLGLVVYVDPNTVVDITDQVVAQMNAQ